MTDWPRIVDVLKDTPVRIGDDLLQIACRRCRTVSYRRLDTGGGATAPAVRGALREYHQMHSCAGMWSW